MQRHWVILIYKIPSTPTKLRLFFWRKFKKLNAQYIQDSVVILPFSERNVEHMRWIAEEIREVGGTTFLWESVPLGYDEEQQVTRMFLESTAEKYEILLNKIQSLEQQGNIEKKELKKLVNEFTQTKKTDYFSQHNNNINVVGKKLDELLRRFEKNEMDYMGKYRD